MGNPVHFIAPGTEFAKGDQFSSKSGYCGATTTVAADLVFQADGNLVLYDETNHARWSSHTASGQTTDPGARCVFQSDGNLVVYDAAGKALWASGTWGHPNSLLALQDDGNAVIYCPFPRALWASHTEHHDPANIGLRMQYQETSEWCWLSVAASISRFYDPGSTVTQAALITKIGIALNGFPAGTVCSPTAAILRAHSGLQSKLADPYSNAAEYALDGVGIPAMCIKSGGADTALQYTGNFASTANALTLAQITTEIDNRRPIVADIAWGGQLATQHAVVIAGVKGDQLRICDPANGESVIAYADFPGKYLGGAVLVGYYLTKAA